MEPAVFTDVSDDNFIAIEESFGPIMIISKFEDGYVGVSDCSAMSYVMHVRTVFAVCFVFCM